MMLLGILTAAAVLLLGFWLMKRIDDLMASGRIVDCEAARINCGALVYAAPEIHKYLCKAGIRCVTLTRPQYPDEGFYSALFALSESDLDNLALCRAAKEHDLGVYIVARCCDAALYGVYRDIGVDRILRAGEPEGAIAAELWGDEL